MEWRALHMGENLRFFEPVRSRTTLRRASLGRAAPTPPNGEEQPAHPKKLSTVIDTPFPSFIDDEFILNKLAKLLNNRRFDEAIRRIPELAELCLGIARPSLDNPPLRYDPVVLPKNAG